MSYRQAFHTSCRSGLSGHAGFQYNAASGGLDEEQLARLAAAHAGYRASPDAPLEPGPAEIELMPVNLRYLPVDGVGPVVSRTAYVGREFRGAGGEADSGRFGNYFTHIVVGDAEDGAAFDGLLPIELWQAPHWSITESTTTELPDLDRIEPGGVDLDGVLNQLLPSRAAALPVVLDACLRAVLDGPRVIVVEAEHDLAAAWIAWASFALPPDRVGGLTFSTFDGRPRTAEAVRVCVTAPACDVDFPLYELGTAAVVVDTAAPAPASELSLYARVAGALASTGAEAVAAATRELDRGLDLTAAGAQLAVLAERTDLADAADVPSVLVALRDRLGRAPAASIAGMAAALPAGGSPEDLAEWARLHAAARQCGDPEATGLVDEALRRLLRSLDDTSPEIEVVGSDSPVVPSVGVLAQWLELVSAAVESERLAPTLAAGTRLGLVGCNTALDKELAGAIAAGFGDPAVREAYESIARTGNDRLVECVALELASAVGAGGGLGPLRHVAADRVAREAVRGRAEQDGSFEAVAAWQLLRVSGDPTRRASAVAALAALATTDRQAELIRGLYGDDGPASAEEHTELLAGWMAAGRGAPANDCRQALDCLAALPLRKDEGTAGLFRSLGKAPKSVRAEPEYLSWWLLFEAPPKRQGFRRWAEVVAKAEQSMATLPDSRWKEIRSLAADVAVANLEEDDYAAGLEALLGTMGKEWPLELGDALGRSLATSSSPELTLVRAFVEWHRPKAYCEALIETALPRATRDLSPKRLEATGERLSESGRRAWERWLEEHPPRRAVSRAVRGVLRRGERE